MKRYKDAVNDLRGNTVKEVSTNRANVIIDTPGEVAASKSLRNDPVDTPEELQEEAENQRQFGPR